MKILGEKMGVVIKNAGVAIVVQIITLLFRFVLQAVLVENLGIEYLGYNAVFTNILQMLNMADLGVGVAVTSFLYKPISEENILHVRVLMHIYKRIYHLIGYIVLGIGILIVIILPIIIPDAKCSYSYLRVAFLVYLLGTVSTYFLSYKRTLVIAQQKSYYTNIIDLIMNVVCTIIQIYILYHMKNYLLFLLLIVGRNIVSNLIISSYCDHINNLSGEIDLEISMKYKQSILEYVKDIFVSKIGAFIFHGTDNIVISMIKGSIQAGKLSNYSLVTTAMQSLVTQIFSAQQATYGNYISVESDKTKQMKMTDNYFFAGFYMANISLVVGMFLLQPFIELFYGYNLLLNYNAVILISINMALAILLTIPSQVFVIYRLYRYDKAIVAFSAGINIIISILLVWIIGVEGALIGTLLSSIIYLISRLFIIASKVYGISCWYYFRKLALYCCSSLCTVYFCYLIDRLYTYYTWGILIKKTFCVVGISVIIPIIFLYNTQELKFYVRIVKRR